MATAISSEITNMQNQTAFNNLGVNKTMDDNDSNMFLTLMLLRASILPMTLC